MQALLALRPGRLTDEQRGRRRIGAGRPRTGAESLGDAQSAVDRSILIIGYGNLSRRDDGVAYHIVERLGARLGRGAEQTALVSVPSFETEAELAEGLCVILTHQLAPELAESLAECDLVVFVDAHVEGAGWAPVHWQEVTPAYQSSLVGHHLKPASVVALTESLYGHSPRAYVLSVLGTDFDFGEGLSAGTSERADLAVERLLALVRSGLQIDL
jgi:hydrogenase maturation protease